HAAPLRVMRIVDATTRLIRSPAVTFRASEIGEDHFGLNIPNSHLNAALEQAVGTEAGIEWRRAMVSGWETGESRVTAELDDGGSVSARLAVAADGRTSPARQAAGIRTSTRNFQQSALVL